jgi:hypothetical protein
MFLSLEELQQLTGYHGGQRVRMCRWLDDKGIPYTANRLGNPVVLRSDVESAESESAGPRLDWLKTA